MQVIGGIRRLVGSALGYEAELARREREAKRLRMALLFYRVGPASQGRLSDIADAAYHAALAAIPVGVDCDVQIECIRPEEIRFVLVFDRGRPSGEVAKQ